jgi:branched-chain amino acid transport system ATP-binding protein
MSKTEILLKLKNVSVNYGELKALDNVDIDLDEGEIVAVMGPNGAGKSTILKTIFGLTPTPKGDVLWHEQKVDPISFEMVERGISFVPQGRRVLKSLTIKENLEMGAFTIKNKKRIKEMMNEVGEIFPILKQRMNDKSGSLSGGQQQMLAIARGLMTDPKVLLLDEPTLGLAPKIVKEVFEKIKEINKKYKTAIMIVEHNIKSVLDVANRAYILDKGKVVWADGADKLKNSDILEKVFTGKFSADTNSDIEM